MCSISAIYQGKAGKIDSTQILNELNDMGVNDYKLAELIGIERSKLMMLWRVVKQQLYDDEGELCGFTKAARENKSDAV
jgi:hypothetical protein